MATTWSTADSIIRDNVQLGIWTNWSRGPVFGATLSLSRDNGNLLIAFTAFFVGLISSRFWRLACRLFHRFYSTPNPQDALHHQRQAILRNSEVPGVGIWGLGLLYFAWRRCSARAFLRIVPTFLAAALCIIAFAVASGFSSRISTGVGNEVLLDGSGCGLPNRDATAGPANSTGVALIDTYRAKLVSAAENYARQCYASGTGGGAGLFDCNRFVVSRLPVSINDQAPCPFTSGICRSNTSNLFLDTGYLDSHEHLGLNAPSSDRILFRHVYHCAPLRTDSYSSNFTGEAQNYTRYNYGPAIFGSGNNRTLADFTYQAETLDFQYAIKRDDTYANRGANFRLAHIHSVSINGTVVKSESGFVPGPDLHRSDGDVKVIFLVGNGVKFDQPTDDDWYRAHVPSKGSFNGITNDTYPEYQPDEAASPMACIEQFQYCNPNRQSEPKCGPLASYYDASLGAGPMFNITADDVMNNMTADNLSGSRYLWLANYLSSSATLPPKVLQVLGAKALLSQQTLDVGYQGVLADNQWKLDVTHWWSTWLASLQAGYVGTAIGPQDPALNSLLRLPGDSTQQAMCNSQKIQSNEYVSFSVFGLLFVFITGALIILVSYLLDPIFDCLERRSHFNKFKNHEWKANDVLYLQSLGFERLRRGKWLRRANSVPVTRRGDLFEALTLIGDSNQVDEDVEKSLVVTTSISGTQKSETRFEITGEVDKEDKRNMNKKAPETPPDSPKNAGNLSNIVFTDQVAKGDDK